jgi:hypothetical protein
MTDERIEQDAIELAEDFTDWMGPSWPMMGAFAATRKLAIMSNKRLRAAERLAKIEVLEELNKQICLQDTKVPEYMDFDTYMKGACDNINESLRIINKMLSDLKGEQ